MLKRYLNHVIFKLIGTTTFTRLIEWKFVFKLLNPQKGDKICDIACGGGTLSLKIAEKGCEVHGIDISEFMIKKAKNFAIIEHIRCEFVVGDAEYLPYKSGYFDKIVCNCSLEHFQNDIKALKEMNRILRENGYIVLTVDSLSYPKTKEYVREKHRETDFVVNYYTIPKLKERLQKAGFNMVYSKYYLNSSISSFFFELGMNLEWSGKLFRASAPIFYALCLISDRIFGTSRGGYGLAVKAKKCENVK